MTNHVDLTENHVIHTYEYADETARLAATGFVAADIGKTALQIDATTFWILTSITPAWAQVAGSGAAGTFTALSDTPASYVGFGLQHVRVNTDANGLEFHPVVTINLTEGQVGKQDATGDLMEYAGATVDATQKWTFDNALSLNPNTLLLGNALELSEGGGAPVFGNALDDTMSFPIISEYNDLTGAGVPTYIEWGASFDYDIYTDDTQVITTNPLTFSFTSAVVAPDLRMIDKLTFKVSSAMTNVAIKITDNATGTVLKHLPSLAAWEGRVDGYAWPIGLIDIFMAETGTDTASQFYFGRSPIITDPAQVVDIEVQADTMNLLGDVSDNAYFLTKAHDGPLTELSTSIATGLELLTEGSNTGWRLIGKDEAGYGDIGSEAVDLSHSTGPSLDYGATGTASLAHGLDTEASALASFAGGILTVASGVESFAHGIGTIALNAASVALGAYNEGTSALTQFEIGIGTTDVARANAFEVFTAGEIVAPALTEALITAEATGRVLITKEYAASTLTPTGLELLTDGGTGWRLIGRDPLNYGDIGFNAIDISTSSTASSTYGATGTAAFAFGSHTTASGQFSYAGGSLTTASGTKSFAFGTETIASGDHAIALGEGVLAINTHSIALGAFNVGTSLLTHFEVGIGSEDILRANGLEVFVTGEVTAPEVTDALITAEATGKVLTTREFIEDTLDGTIGAIPYLRGYVDPLPDEAGAVALYTDTTGLTLEPAQGFSVIATPSKVELNLKPSGTTSDTSIHFHDSLDNEVFEINRFSDAGGIQITNRVANFNIINEAVANINITPAVTNNVTIAGGCAIASANETNMRVRVQVPAAGAIAGVHIREFASDSHVLSMNYNDGTASARVTSNAATRFDIESTFADVDMQFKTVGAGQFLFNSDFAFTGPDATTHKFEIFSGSSGAQIQILTAADVLAVLMFYEESTLDFFFENIHGDMFIEAQNVVLEGAEITVRGNAALGLPKLTIGDNNETLQSSVFVESADPDGSVTGAGGDVVLRVDGASSASYESREATTGTNWFKRSVSPSNRIEIFNTADFEALETTAGLITITSDTTLVFRSEAEISTATRIEVTGGDLLMTGDNYTATGILYTGNGIFITNNNPTSDVRLRGRLRINGNNSGTLCSMVNTANPYNDLGDWVVLDIDDCTLQDWDDLGEIERGVLFIRNTNLVTYNAPFTLTETNITSNNIALAFGGRAFEFFSAQAGANGDTITVDGVTPVNMTAAPIYVDPHQAEGSTFRISNLNTGDIAIPIFYTAGGSTGAFTVVTDASDGAHPITAVADSGGFARFTAGTAALIPGMTIVISGYVTNTDYNGTWIATNVVGSSFDASDGLNLVIFGTGEVTGVVTNSSVRVTSTGHGLSTDDTLYLDTDESTAYDGGYKIYNAATNTFDINATFAGTATGSWDTSGRDQKDVRTLALNNKNQQASAYIGTAYVNANVINVGTIVNGVYKVCTFGSAGVALLEGSTMERFKLIDEIEGEFEYTGTEPFDGHITFDFTVVSSGGSQDFLFKWRKDTGGGFINLVDDAEALVNVGSDAGSVSKTFPLTMETGDVIKPFVTRDSGNSPLTITYATIFATQ